MFKENGMHPSGPLRLFLMASEKKDANICWFRRQTVRSESAIFSDELPKNMASDFCP